MHDIPELWSDDGSCTGFVGSGGMVEIKTGREKSLRCISGSRGLLISLATPALQRSRLQI